VCFLTAALIIIVHARMLEHVHEDLVSVLRAESVVSSDFVRLRREQTEKSAAMIADQPSLIALMSTDDPPTVQDGSEPFLKSTGADLLILEDAEGKVLASQSTAGAQMAALEGLMEVSRGEQDWWFTGGHLYDVSFVPIVAGAGSEKRVLGRIALGTDLTAQSLLRNMAFGKAEFAIERHGNLWLSSLQPAVTRDFPSSTRDPTWAPGAIRDLDLGGERYLANYVELAGDHPVRLYCLESFDQATVFLRSLHRALAILGVFAVIAGASLAFVISRQITRPLERLVSGTQRLKQGDFEFQIPVQGTDEVAELTRAFDEMRNSLRQSRETLLRSARLEAVGRLAGGVAHDFNNLVMIIKGYSDLLLDTATPEARGHIEEIKNAGDRASALTRQLLAFSRKQVLEPQVLDPNQSVRNMVKMLRILIGEDIELVTNFSDEIGRVLADPGQLEQVVMNLAVNARDAMPKGGKLIIETQACALDEQYAAAHAEVTLGPAVMMAVTDTGCGMSKETLAHIFEPFFTTKEAGKGTGLGLATVYGIVKQSKGHISVYSELGRGTTFKVYLPALESSTPVTAQIKTSSAPKGAGTILLIEDESALRVLAVEALKRLGYEVLSAKDGVEALGAAEQHSGKIDVVVTDVVMPRMGGPELVEKLRHIKGGFGVIFMSGYTAKAALESAMIAPDACLLNKPFASEVLAQKIREVQDARSHKASQQSAKAAHV
jgi:signal transduction histidine kinase/CheY-like chemotaxis protein